MMRGPEPGWEARQKNITNLGITGRGWEWEKPTELRSQMNSQEPNTSQESRSISQEVTDQASS